MPSFVANKTAQVSLNEDASEEDLRMATRKAVEQGGKITQEYTLIKAFAVEFPDDVVNTLASLPCVNSVERDAKVTI
ncbi:hypothetical protein Dda_7132 [Drechslerella dactyloides]|uniref:Inhibitor I9 domain-containing protein n=1 Tax=Drechslerella dactyloides TaxID=74499 RepID=A0AAD6IT70_DREDA|nr:hypothetical protein Dda_7132 [Drechslerella dactyloides]